MLIDELAKGTEVQYGTAIAGHRCASLFLKTLPSNQPQELRTALFAM